MIVLSFSNLLPSTEHQYELAEVKRCLRACNIPRDDPIIHDIRTILNAPTNISFLHPGTNKAKHSLLMGHLTQSPYIVAALQYLQEPDVREGRWITGIQLAEVARRAGYVEVCSFTFHILDLIFLSWK